MLFAPDRAAAWHPDRIDWQEIGADGTRYALLEGSRSQAGGLFTYAFFIPAGFWDPAHRHSTDARIVVLKGTLKLGYGDRLERPAAAAFPVGSFVLVPGGAPHFDGADEDTIIIGTAQGVWSTIYIDASHRPSAGTPKPVEG